MSGKNDNKQVTTYKKKSQLESIWFRYKKNRLAMVGLFMLAIMILLAVSAPLFADYQKDAVSQNMKLRYLEPSFVNGHIFGTDHYGRDVFARVIYGGRISLFVGLTSVIISALAGTTIGSVAGYYGGRVDNTLMRLMDVLLAIPQNLLAISIVAALGPGMFNLLIAMSVSGIPEFSRIVRASVLNIKNQEFVEAAVACGTNDARIIRKYIVPNAIGPLIVQATLAVAKAILSISALSFIGLGVSPPTPEWGSMLSEAKSDMRLYPYLVIIPGIAIMLSVVALNLIGDGLRDSIDPRLKN